MIEKAAAFKVGEKTFATLAEAQKCEVEELFKDVPQGADMAEFLVGRSERLLEILKSTGRKPRVSKKKTAVKVATPRAGKVQTEIPKA